MNCKLLEENDIELMKNFVDDEETKYNEEFLKNFINEKNTYGFIMKDENEIIGFAYGYLHIRPDGKKDFYLHAIDIMKNKQGNGYGTTFMKYINNYIHKIGCHKMFLITNKSNSSACKCYEKSGGINTSNDDIIYVFK